MIYTVIQENIFYNWPKLYIIIYNFIQIWVGALNKFGRGPKTQKKFLQWFERGRKCV